MKLYKKFLVATILLFPLTGCVSTKNNREALARQEQLGKEETWRYEIPLQKNTPKKPAFPNVLQTQLKNGLKIFVVEDKSLPIANIQIVLKGGSSIDPGNKWGLMNLTMQMLKEGAGEYTSLELAEEFSNLGTEVGTYTAKDKSQLSVSSLSTHLEKIMHLLSLMILKPRFDEQDFKRVHFETLNTLLANKARPNYLAQLSFLKAAYGEDHPYAHASIGDDSTLAKLNSSSVKQFHKENFFANNSALIVVGDVTIEKVEQWAEKYFSGWEKSTQKTFRIAEPKQQKEMQTLLVQRANTPQTFLLIGRPVVSRTDKDLAAFQVLQQIIAGLPSSRLDALLREEKGWTYGVSSTVNPLKGKGPMMVQTSIQVPYGSEALKEILGQFEKLRQNEVSDQEIENAKTVLLNSFLTRYNTVGNISQILAEQFVYDLASDSDQKSFDQISQVTKKDIAKIAKAALGKKDLTAVAVGDLEVMRIPLQQMKVGRVIIEREPVSSVK